MIDATIESLAEVARYKGGVFLEWLRAAREDVIKDFVALDPKQHIEMVQFQAQAVAYDHIITHLEGCSTALEKSETDGTLNEY